MKEKYTSDELKSFQRDIQYALSMMEQMKAQHPSAKVTYELLNKRVSVSYPLPSDSDPKRTEKFLKEVTFKQKPVV